MLWQWTGFVPSSPGSPIQRPNHLSSRPIPEHIHVYMFIYIYIEHSQYRISGQWRAWADPWANSQPYDEQIRKVTAGMRVKVREECLVRSRVPPHVHTSPRGKNLRHLSQLDQSDWNILISTDLFFFLSIGHAHWTVRHNFIFVTESSVMAVLFLRLGSMVVGTSLQEIR